MKNWFYHHWPYYGFSSQWEFRHIVDRIVASVKKGITPIAGYVPGQLLSLNPKLLK